MAVKYPRLLYGRKEKEIPDPPPQKKIKIHGGGGLTPPPTPLSDLI